MVPILQPLPRAAPAPLRATPRAVTWARHRRLGLVGLQGVQSVLLQLLPGAPLAGLTEHRQGVSYEKSHVKNFIIIISLPPKDIARA